MVLVTLLIPTVRLAVIVGNDGYHQAAAAQSVYTVHVGSGRGTIYDRNMKKLTNAEYAYVGTAGYSANPALLAAAIAETAAEPSAALEAARSGKPFLFSAVKAYDGGGVLSFPVYSRYSGVAAHLVGYPTTATDSGYTGLESAFSPVLDRYSGSISVTYTVDARGRNLSGLEPTVSDTMARTAGGVVLTLDSGLQRFAQEQLTGVCGAVVVLSADGDILACASSPTFDPDDIAAALSGEGSPLLNRALCAYDVGSVFKTVVTAAALEAGVSPDRSYECTGQINVGGVVIHCNNRRGHGEVNLKTALVHSCNPYFIDLATELGAERIVAAAEAMGFGESIELAEGVSSRSGNLPSIGSLAPPAALANLAIGQGTLLATPLQIAAAINCAATGGVYITPRLVLHEVDENGNTVETYPAGESRRVMSEQTAAVLLSNMTAVFADGSLSQYQPRSHPAAGKTSTAQTGMIAEDGHSVCQAWLAGVFPAEDPMYTVAVLVEDGVAGSTSCGPVFQAVCEYIAANLMN